MEKMNELVKKFHDKYFSRHFHGLTSGLQRPIIGEFNKIVTMQILKANGVFSKELVAWRVPAKLVTLGECTQSAEGHIYINQKTFNNYFKPLKSVIVFENKDQLREFGVLNIDVYKYPLNSDMYAFDKGNELYDQNYIKSQLICLNKNGIIDENTVFVFRYKRVMEKTRSEVYEILREINKDVQILDEPLGYGIFSSELNEKIKHNLKQILTQDA
jgi:hypothetical protein